MLKKMRAVLANHNHCAVPFLSRAAVNLNWYDINIIVQYTLYSVQVYVTDD